jgi:hypothetical protein
VPADIEIGPWPPGAECGLPHFAYRVPKTDADTYPAVCPIIEAVHDNQLGQLVVPWPDGVEVSPLLKCYLVSYYLGMLVRYFPSRWMALIRRQKGDAVLPLLRSAMAHVEEDFPKLALALL